MENRIKKYLQNKKEPPPKCAELIVEPQAWEIKDALYVINIVGVDFYLIIEKGKLIRKN